MYRFLSTPRTKHNWRAENHSGVTPNWAWQIAQICQVRFFWITEFSSCFETQIFQFMGSKLQLGELVTPLWFSVLRFCSTFTELCTVHNNIGLWQWFHTTLSMFKWSSSNVLSHVCLRHPGLVSCTFSLLMHRIFIYSFF